MNAKEECIPCILNFCMRTLNFCELPEGDRERILSEISAKLEHIPLDRSPATIADYATRIIKERVGIEDLYAAEKKNQNAKALAVYPRLKEMVERSEDRLKAAFLVSAMGNIIDLGAHADFDVEAILRDFTHISFAKDDFEVFRRQLEDSCELLFIADNCGEIIFDRVLLEELSDIRRIVAVKTIPFINDVTIDDIQGTGIEDVAEIIQTGTCNLDFSTETINPGFLEHFRTADVVISKGHANFEALHGTRKDIFFLLRAKCNAVADVIGVRKGDFIFTRIPS
jgi:uncharacterized protein with ATP-grasp and redox domains